MLSRGGPRLLDGADIRIQAGERHVILGANGAGKSLLMRVLHGLTPPDQGSVLWKGKALDANARKAQALVFQRPVLLRRSVRANVAFALSARGIWGSEAGDRVDKALKEARLDGLADRPARQLSGGEQQRLALARALVTEPELLLLDEPTASLDPASIQAFEGLLETAANAGVTLVTVTHDLGQARRLGDFLHFMHRGRVVESGRVAECLEAPKTEALQAWLEGRLFV